MGGLLFVLTRPPHSGAYCRESLDLVLTAAAFGQQVSLLLVDDAVLQIKSGQRVGQGGQDTAALFKALPLYDIHAVYVEQESLAERGLAAGGLLLPARPLPRAGLAAWMSGFERVLAG